MSLLVRGASVAVSQDAGRRVLKNVDVLVESNRITEIGKVRGKAGAEFIVDGKGKMLLPGLVNAHTHLGMTLLRGYADDMPFREWWAKVRPVESRLKERHVYWGSLLGCLEMIRSGTTSFADMYFHMDSVAKAVKECGMRANLAYAMIDFGDEGKRKRELAEGERFFREWNGKAGARIACSFGPHAPYSCSKELLQTAAGIARERRARLQIHVSETRKEVFEAKKNLGKRPVEYLDSIGFLWGNVIAVHSVWVTKGEIAMLARSGAHVAHCPVSNLKLASGESAPTMEILKAGGRLALGTDGAASNNSLSMLETMKFAALLEKGSRWDASALNAQAVLDAATIGGSAALGFDTGRIEVGRLADFITLDLRMPNLAPLHNPVSHIAYAANPSNVCDVVVDGKPLMLGREIVCIDEEKVVEKASEEGIALARGKKD